MVKLIDPFPGHYDASDPYGNIRPNGLAHTGSDWGMPADTPIPAISNGLCVYTGFNAGTGNCLVVRMSNNLYWAYLHMSVPALVAQGATVHLGEIIGLVGTTGSTSGGNHLHITMSDAPTAYVGGGNTFDPYAYIMANLNGGGNIRFVQTSAGPRMYRVA